MKEAIYGYPCVEDPNDFSPDTECCSPEEIATWTRACETYGTPDYVPNRGSETSYDEQGRFVKHVTRTSWGIGINMVDVYDERDAADERGQQELDERD